MNYHVRYNDGDGVVEIIVRDETGTKVEHFKMNWKDTKRHAYISKKLKDKYGIDLNPILPDIPDTDSLFDF